MYKKPISIQQAEWRRIPDIRFERNYTIIADVQDQILDRWTTNILSSFQIRRTCTFESVCTIGPLNGYLQFDCANGFLVTAEQNRLVK